MKRYSFKLQSLFEQTDVFIKRHDKTLFSLIFDQQPRLSSKLYAYFQNQIDRSLKLACSPQIIRTA